MYILDVCASSGILKIFAFLKIILNFIFIIAPIGLIIMVSIDFAKAVISGDADAQKKSMELGFNRILYAVFLFAVPYMVSVIVTILGNMGSDYARCLELAGNPEAIAQLEKEENAKKEAKKDAKKAQLDAQTEKARIAAENKKRALTIVNDYNGSDAETIKGEGCDGVVYYENGTFYKPSSALVPTNGLLKTKGSAEAGYNKYFYANLTRFVEDAKKEGYIITPSPNEGDGAWRSYERQQYWWEYYGHDRNMAAFPGNSNHGWAIASDLKYGSDAAIEWAHNNAEKYNLKFRVPKENWHIEPLSVEINDEKAKACV